MRNIAETETAQIVNLCRSCNNALRNGNYNVKTINPGEIKTIRQCDCCGHRLYCGRYELFFVKPNRKKQKSKAKVVAEEIAEEIKDRNL